VQNVDITALIDDSYCCEAIHVEGPVMDCTVCPVPAPNPRRKNYTWCEGGPFHVMCTCNSMISLRSEGQDG